MGAPYVRSNLAPDTEYVSFKQVHSARDTARDGVTDSDTGRSPIGRYLAYAFDYADVVSATDGSAWVVNCIVPRGSLIRDALLRLDEEFDGTNADSVEIGDSNQASGYAAAIDLTAVPGDTPLWYRDADALYVNRASDVAAGATGAQYYQHGGVVVVLLATGDAPTTGRAILFLETISYCEDQDAEW